MRGRITGALLMAVAAAFPSVARGCLLRKVRTMGIDENLASWTDMRKREEITVLECLWSKRTSIILSLSRTNHKVMK